MELKPGTREVPRIMQIIPAEGWHTVYVDGNETPFLIRLVCWAMVEEEGEVFVRGMEAGGAQEGVQIVNENFDSNFLGYAAPGSQMPDWIDRAKEYSSNRPNSKS